MKFEHVFYAVIVLGIAGILIFSFIYFGKPEQQQATGSFQVDSLLLKTSISTDGSFSQNLRISNLENKQQHFEIAALNLDNLVSTDITSFDLNAEDVASIKVLFSNKKSLSEGVYPGLIEVSSEQEKQNVPVILEIESKDVLFDTNVALYPSSKVAPGEKINAEIKILSLAKIETANVALTYSVKNFNGEEILSDKEGVVVKNQALVSKTIQLPKNILEGDYVFSVTVKYKESVGSASAVFSVAKSKIDIFSFLDWRIAVIIAILLFVVLLGILLEFERRKLRDVIYEQAKDIKKIDSEIKVKRVSRSQASDMSKQVDKKLDVLERAYNSGYISKTAYTRGKSRIQELKRKLEKKRL